MLGWSRSPVSIGLLCGCGATSPQLMRMGWGRAETSAAVIPSPVLAGAWSGVRATRGVNHNGDRAESRGSDNLPAARVLRPRCSRRHLPAVLVARHFERLPAEHRAHRASSSTSERQRSRLWGDRKSVV